jgi:uncharacterized membrane protein
VDSLLDDVVGLPMHPLVVHAVVVLVPLSALSAIVMVARPAFSRRFGPLTVALAGAGVLGAVLAKASGERLAESVGTPAQHANLGERLPLVAIGYFVLLLGFWLVDRGIPANRRRPGWLTALGVLLVVAAVVVTVGTVWTGHSGAEATWRGVLG